MPAVDGKKKEKGGQAQVPLECPVCKAVMKEIAGDIAKIDPKKMIQTGSFRIGPDGELKDMKVRSTARERGGKGTRARARVRESERIMCSELDTALGVSRLSSLLTARYAIYTNDRVCTHIIYMYE